MMIKGNRLRIFGLDLSYYLENISNFILDKKFFFAIFFAAVLGRILQSSKSNIFSAWIMFLTGTFFHEMAHFLVGLVTFSMPYKFSIIPKKSEDGNGYILGHVKFLNSNWYNIAITSLAPVLLMPLAYFVYDYYFFYFEFNLLNFIIWIFLIVSLLFSSIPSSVDIKNIFSGNFIANIFGFALNVIIILFMFFIGEFYGYI